VKEPSNLYKKGQHPQPQKQGDRLERRTSQISDQSENHVLSKQDTLNQRRQKTHRNVIHLQ